MHQGSEASSQGLGPYFFAMDFLGGEVSSSMTTSSRLDLNFNHDQIKDNWLTFMLVSVQIKNTEVFVFFFFFIS